jgi:hypothetical protein
MWTAEIECGQGGSAAGAAARLRHDQASAARRSSVALAVLSAERSACLCLDCTAYSQPAATAYRAGAPAASASSYLRGHKPDARAPARRARHARAATLEIEAWAYRRAEERFAVKAASVAVAAPKPAADSSQAAPGPGGRPRSAPLTRPVANRPTRPSSGSTSRRPVSILSQLTPR